MSNESVINKLDQLVMLKTEGFCYGCYIKAKISDEGEKCPKCGSDDLMRFIEGIGCEYGTKAFYKAVLDQIHAEKCLAIFDDDWYEEFLNECYGTVKVGQFEWDAGHVIKELDPTSFQIGLNDAISSAQDDNEIVEIDGGNYWTDQLEELIDAAIDEAEVVKQ